MQQSYGALNGAIVGTLMKEAIRRAIVAIRAQRFTFEASVKGVGSRGQPDLVTTADRAAQRVFVKLLRDWFPTFGVVAEEDRLSVPCTDPDRDLWFTVDPLDGTHAYVRRQSHGIGTMLSLVCDGSVIAACVGDVMTQEVYAMRPESPDVYRISEFGIAETLVIEPARPLAEQWLQLRQRPSEHSPLVEALVNGPRPLFHGYEIAGGSIGISMARLWKGEIGAELLRPGRYTPWDDCPVEGISRVLGFRFMAIDPAARTASAIEPAIAGDGIAIDREVLVIHESRIDEFNAWLAGVSG